MPQPLIFDVFGTCVDWRTSIARAVAEAVPGIDPFAFADCWRAGYDPAMAPVRDGTRRYTALDDLHVETLRTTCTQFGTSLPDCFARAWERLVPWPDTVPGLTALKANHIVAPCSNGSIALMTHLARFAGLPWTASWAPKSPATTSPTRPSTALPAPHCALRPKRLRWSPHITAISSPPVPPD